MIVDLYKKVHPSENSSSNCYISSRCRLRGYELRIDEIFLARCQIVAGLNFIKGYLKTFLRSAYYVRSLFLVLQIPQVNEMKNLIPLNDDILKWKNC